MSGKRYNRQEIPSAFKKMRAFIGGILLQYRWEQDLTIKETQELSGIHHRTISRIENGESISLTTLFHYLNFLGLEMTDIAFSYEEIE